AQEGSLRLRVFRQQVGGHDQSFQVAAVEVVRLIPSKTSLDVFRFSRQSIFGLRRVECSDHTREFGRARVHVEVSHKAPPASGWCLPITYSSHFSSKIFLLASLHCAIAHVSLPLAAIPAFLHPLRLCP